MNSMRHRWAVLPFVLLGTANAGSREGMSGVEGSPEGARDNCGPLWGPGGHGREKEQACQGGRQRGGREERCAAALLKGAAQQDEPCAEREGEKVAEESEGGGE